MHNYKLVLEYDGTDYHGWQKQPDLPTVQGMVEDALARVAEVSSPLYAAGRTDAGVHARCQVVNFRGAIKPSTDRMPDALNAFLPQDIVVKGCEEVGNGFDARRSAKAREYVYYIHRGAHPSPFSRRYTYHYDGELDLRAMEESLRMLLGEHDFAAFSRRDEDKSSVREVYEAELIDYGEMLGIRLRANAFVWMMMRMLCGSLLEVGRGKWTAALFWEVLRSGDNSSSGPSLPARGLFLEAVYY